MKCEKKPILCAGLTPALQRTLEFELFRPGGVNRARSVSLSVGGKQVNTARMVFQLGGNPQMTGFCGGPDGRRVEAVLRAEGLAFDFVETEGNTRTCQTLLDAASGSVTELVEEAAGLTVEDWCRFEEKFAELQWRAEWMVFSGTLPPSAPDDFLLRLLRLTECSCLIDSHHTPLLHALAARPRLVKLNREELQKTVPGLPPEAALRGLLAAGSQAVLMTDGKYPALLIEAAHPEVISRIRPPEVSVVNPIGSGDAVTAGVAVALARGESLPEAVRFGMACGTAQTLTRTAGQLPAPAVIAELHERTVLERG